MPVGEYTIKVSVDGEDVDESNYCSNAANCIFTVSFGKQRDWGQTEIHKQERD